MGDYNLLRRGRVEIGDEQIVINVGIRKSICFDLNEIESFLFIKDEKEMKHSKKTFWVIATPIFYKSLIGIKDDINCQIVLKRPVKAFGFLGISKPVTHINFSIDNPKLLIESIEKKVGGTMLADR